MTAHLLLSDTQWQRIEHLLAGKVSDRGVATQDNRRFVAAVLWIGRTGAPWRDLPPELGNWHNTHVRFSCWAQNGVWARLFSDALGNPLGFTITSANEADITQAEALLKHAPHVKRRAFDRHKY